MLIQDLQPFQQWSNTKHFWELPSHFSKKFEVKVSTSECYRPKWETSKGWKTISSTNNHEDCFSLQDSEPVASFIEKLPLIVSKNLQENTVPQYFLIKLQS